MDLPKVLKLISENSEIAEALDCPFDFRFTGLIEFEREFPELLTNEKLLVFAFKGSGDAYAFKGERELESRPIVFIGSEGSTGQIADNVNDLLKTIIFITVWESLADRDSVEEMRKWQAEFDNDYLEDFPKLNEARKELANKLGLGDEGDTFDKFLKTCQSAVVPFIRMKNEEDTDFRSLFGSSLC